MKRQHMPGEEKGTPARIDLTFMNELDDIRIGRIKKDLEKEMIPFREVTRMIKNTENWKNVKEELINKPRKK